MTNKQILVWAAGINYAHLNITPTCAIRCGCEHWEAKVAELTEEQRERLVAKIERWEAMRAREVRA